MEFKSGLGWKACYDEERDLYTAETSWRGSYHLYEINKEIYDRLDKNGQEGENPSELIGQGRCLFEADDDYYTQPYCIAHDSNYNEISPWSDAKRRADAMAEYYKKKEQQETYKKEQEENKMKLTPFFKAVLDADRAPIVLCKWGHEIVYMNPAAIKRYEKRGGEKLIGKSLLDCHNEESKKKISNVLDWFMLSKDNNIVYIFRNEKENKDVYMVALRDDEGALIGYYEKHEYRDHETMKLYDME